MCEWCPVQSVYWWKSFLIKISWDGETNQVLICENVKRSLHCSKLVEMRSARTGKKNKWELLFPGACMRIVFLSPSLWCLWLSKDTISHRENNFSIFIWCGGVVKQSNVSGQFYTFIQKTRDTLCKILIRQLISWPYSDNADRSNSVVRVLRGENLRIWSDLGRNHIILCVWNWLDIITVSLKFITSFTCQQQHLSTEADELLLNLTFIEMTWIWLSKRGEKGHVAAPKDSY